jgi:pimeloyl-ACP methyl ester carboxylesterase
MLLESLEGRVLFYGPVDTSRVFLGDINDNPTTINRHMVQVFLAHGDQMDGAAMVDFAHAVQAQLPANQYQVIIIDWGDLAIPPAFPGDTSHHGDGNATVNAFAVGDKVAGLVQAARAMPSRVNLVGYSMGGTVIDRIARDLKTRTTQVNTIIGIDPAAGRIQAPAYAQNSAYAISFCGNDAVAKLTASQSGDDTVVLTGLDPNNDMLRHQSVFTVVTTMWERDGGMLAAGDDHVSSLFSVPALLNGRPLPWRQGAISGGFDASMACGTQANSSDLGPLSITYVNSRRHRITLS